MTLNGWLQLALFVAAVLAVAKPLGAYMTRVFDGRPTLLGKALRPLERLIHRLCGVDETKEQHWTAYSASVLAFSAASMLSLYLLLRCQQWLPLNPQAFGPVSSELAFNTAASFTTNTNWQAYSGESTMSYLAQMAGLAFHNFASAAAGIAVAVAFVRGIAREKSATIGNFWVDMTRATLHVLMPLCLIGALVLVSTGVIQNLKPYVHARLVEPQTIESTAADGTKTVDTRTEQVLPMGPVASQEIIKQLGTNGGGFFNANSAHPFENPTPFSNFLAMVAIFAIGAGLTFTLGKMTGSPRHGWAVLAAMGVLFLAGVLASWHFEARGNPILASAGADQRVSSEAGREQSGGNMEGKEVRFGIISSAIFATATTDASCGAVNGMHDSFTPLGGLVTLANIMLGEIVVGGVGAGLYGMLVMIVLTVFIAGLMVGRTPEYLGKKIEAKDVKLAMIYCLVFAALILVMSSWSSVAPYGTSSTNNGGPHGLSEVVYAFTSATGNNGSAFAGLNANTRWYNVALGLTMLAGRFLMIVPALALAGNLAAKKRVPASSGTFPVTGGLFVLLLLGVILIVGALTFFPMLALGPIVEHGLMQSGQLF
jgi:K+-transporting ATPase ATPase A chain